MHRADFHFDLPPELIAQRPLSERAASRMLVLDAADPQPRDHQFGELPQFLRPNDLLVFNNTRVMRARLFGNKTSGGRVEILIERLLAPDEALAHVRASKAPAPGTRLIVGGVPLEVCAREETLWHLRAIETDFHALMEAQGHIPLPPYIQRPDDAHDESRYQTVYARHIGAVAAPTAGLHFDESMFERLAALGVNRAEVTLHVGAGTFQPVRVDDLEQHRMHAEWVEVSEEVCAQIAETRARGGRVIAVGTTSVRSLESAAADGELKPLSGETHLFIRPGYAFQVVDAILTNFHLPESTLLMLIAAFAGHEQVMQAYRHAVDARYRFFSYGDAMLLLGQHQQCAH